jgi:hypothetical protein
MRVQGLKSRRYSEAVELEYRYAEDTDAAAASGMNASMFKGYLRYIANGGRRRLMLSLLSRTGEPVSVDERDDRFEEGAQFFRNARHRVPKRWCVVVGLTPNARVNRPARVVARTGRLRAIRLEPCDAFVPKNESKRDQDS